MAKPADRIFERYRAICLALPDTKLTMTWDSPHFRVNDKIFAGFGEEDGRLTLGFKLEMEHASDLVEHDPRFARAPYVGHKGWVSMDARAVRSWKEVESLVLESYRLIAPKRSLAKLDAAPGSAPGRAKAAPAKGRAAPRKAATAPGRKLRKK